MAAAWIALIGVALGALLTGIINSMVDSSGDRRRAQTAARAVAGELGSVLNQMQHALRNKYWWSGVLPPVRVPDRFDELAAAASGDQLTAIQQIPDLIAYWNSQQKDRPPDLQKLREDFILLRRARRWLNDLLIYAFLHRWKSPVRRILALAYFIVVAVFVVALVVPREVVNSETVADAVQTSLGSHWLANCNPAGGRWVCAEHHLSLNRSSCTQTDPVTTARSVASFAINLQPKRDCIETAKPLMEDVLVEGNHVVVINDLEGGRQTARSIMIGTFKEPNFIERAVSWIFRDR